MVPSSTTKPCIREPAHVRRRCCAPQLPVLGAHHRCWSSGQRGAHCATRVARRELVPRAADWVKGLAAAFSSSSVPQTAADSRLALRSSRPRGRRRWWRDAGRERGAEWGKRGGRRVVPRRATCAVPPPLLLPWQQRWRRSRPPLSAGFRGNGEAGPSVVVVGGGEPSELLPCRCLAPAGGLTAAPTPENVKGRSRADDPAAAAAEGGRRRAWCEGKGGSA